MSAERSETIGGLDFRLVADLAQEPSYVSEIGRKLHKGDFPMGYKLDTDGDTTIVLDNGEEPESRDDFRRTWGSIDVGTARRKAAGVVNLIMEGDQGELDAQDFAAGQKESSPKYAWAGNDLEELRTWRDYKIVQNVDRSAESVGKVFENTGLDGMARTLRSMVDVEPWVEDGEFVTVEDKQQIIETLSERGNEASMNAERIAQDVFDRQFRYMSEARATAYSSPEPDYEVYEDAEMDYRLMIEVTTRWVNPVDKPYVDAKKESAFDKDADLLIIGPKFTDQMVNKYGVVGDRESMLNAETDLINLVHLPPRDGKFFDPFLMSVSDIPPDVEDRSGNPVIIGDHARVRERLSTVGRVGDQYPIVDADYEEFRDMLGGVNRDFNVIQESQYRNMVRESLEPVLYQFTRPYRIEQFLIDTYWEDGMLQREVAEQVGVSTDTIQRWMDAEHWDIITRGFAGRTTTGTEGETYRPLLSQETAEIWERMYKGEEPFDQKHTAYEIQAEYNRHPLFDLEDWREWMNLSVEERAQIMSVQDSDREGISYTIMLGPEDRLMPSYSYIVSVLRDRGVEIREGFFGETGSVLPTRQALRWMINSNIDTFSPDGSAEAVSVKKMRSSLEVEFAEFLSSQEIPFAYEQLRIPGLYTVEQAQWDDEVERISSGGWTQQELRLWRQIFNKHNLDEPEPRTPAEVLEMFDKREIIPDFVLYPGVGNEKRGPDWGGWEDWSQIVELAGAWGMTAFPQYSNWYRLTGVAFKEFMFRQLGLWNDVTFIIEDSESLTTEIRQDDNYVVVRSNQMETEFASVINQVLD